MRFDPSGGGVADSPFSAAFAASSDSFCTPNGVFRYIETLPSLSTTLYIPGETSVAPLGRRSVDWAIVARDRPKTQIVRIVFRMRFLFHCFPSAGLPEGSVVYYLFETVLYCSGGRRVTGYTGA